MIFKSVDKTALPLYDGISMEIEVSSELKTERADGGIGGILLRAPPVAPYKKDLSAFQRAAEYEKNFDISEWKFFMAFDGARPVGGATLAAKTPEVHMLEGRDDLCVLWDLRVENGYKRRGVGQKLFDMCRLWAKAQGFARMKIECQNDNVPACRFYRKQGAELRRIDEYAYCNDPAFRGEIQLIWYLDL